MRVKKLPVAGATFCKTSQRLSKQTDVQAAQALPSQELQSSVADASRRLSSENRTFQSTSGQLPKRLRRSRRPSEERGLPSDDALRQLAKTYLTHQAKLWPELTERGWLAPATKQNVATLALRFRDRFLNERIDRFEPESSGTVPTTFAAIYVRYSDDGSNPRSLDQQLIGALDRAKKEDVFVPDEYLFFDAAVSATTPDRRGYQMAKQCIETVDEIGFFIVDELSRANRYNVESLTLGELMSRSGNKTILGAADGFDSRQPMAKLLLAVFGALNEWFIDQLRSKVTRGMVDGHRLGNNLCPPAIGYRLVHRLGPSGVPTTGADGNPIRALEINPDESKWIEAAFRLFGEECWSRDRIAEHFNQEAVGGSTGWTSTGIKKLLTRYKYVGIDVYRMTHRVRVKSGNTFKEKIKQRPRREWQVRRARDLQIVSWQLWKKVRARLAETHDAYARATKNPQSRSDLKNNVLFRPSCGCCGAKMILGRSGKYASFTCVNGLTGAHGCTFKGYKSVAIVENSILGHLKEELLTESRFRKLVIDANEHLKSLANRPKRDTKSLRSQIKAEERKRDNVLRLAEDGCEVTSVRDRIRQIEARLGKLKKQLRENERSNAPLPPSLSESDVLRLLGNLRGLLQQDKGRASALLKEITGPITIRQICEPNRLKPTWFADFSVDLVPVALRIAKESNDPSTDTLEFLSIGNWTIAQSCSVKIESSPPYRTLASRCYALRLSGISREKIAAFLGVSLRVVGRAIYFAETGKAPPSDPPRQRRRRRGDTASPNISKKQKHKDISVAVASLRDGKLKSFREIATLMNLSYDTIRRAYMHAHRKQIDVVG